VTVDTLPAVAVRGLTKTFGPRTVLRDVDLALAPESCLALVGPNGAGKTTLLRIVAGLARATTGDVKIRGVSSDPSATETRRQVGFVSHQTLLYENLTAEENLSFYAQLYGLASASRRIDELLENLGLLSRRDEPVGSYSRGMQQRVSLARALLHEPSVLLLDEPFSGLDPQGTSWLQRLIRDSVAAQRAVLLATHRLDLALALGDRLAVLGRGRIVYDAPRVETDADGFAERYHELTA
jgi:heme exporter protein A